MPDDKPKKKQPAQPQPKKKKKKPVPHGAYGPGGVSKGYQNMLEKAYRTGNSDKKKKGSG